MVWSGNTSGIGKNACFNDRGGKYANNAQSLDKMKQHRFYQEYHIEEVDNIGGIGRYFKYIEVYFGMAFR